MLKDMFPNYDIAERRIRILYKKKRHIFRVGTYWPENKKYEYVYSASSIPIPETKVTHEINLSRWCILYDDDRLIRRRTLDRRADAIRVTRNELFVEVDCGTMERAEIESKIRRNYSDLAPNQAVLFVLVKDRMDLFLDIAKQLLPDGMLVCLLEDAERDPYGPILQTANGQVGRMVR